MLGYSPRGTYKSTQGAPVYLTSAPYRGLLPAYETALPSLVRARTEGPYPRNDLVYRLPVLLSCERRRRQAMPR